MAHQPVSPTLVAVTSPVHWLSEQQLIFVKAVVKGTTPITAARMAGYARPDKAAAEVMTSQKVKEAIQYLYKKHEKVADMTRKKVMDGMLEAIDMAKMQADASTMVSGWREIGKMCGYYAPEVKKVDITVSSKRVIDKLETMSDDDLLRFVEEQGRVIEGEATEILNGIQEASDEG
jgi:phage terminase small subunit